MGENPLSQLLVESATVPRATVAQQSTLKKLGKLGPSRGDSFGPVEIKMLGKSHLYDTFRNILIFSCFLELLEF